MDLIQLTALLKAKEELIISASGWRKIFATSKKEDDNNSQLSDDDKYLVAAIANAYYLTYRFKEVIVASDTRPTSASISDIVLQVLTSLDVEVSYLGVAAAPEIMAYSSNSYFLYISASHNPIGHNGFKFGYDKAVFARDENDKIVNSFNTLLEDKQLINSLNQLFSLTEEINFSFNKSHKKKALKAYEKQIKEIAFENKAHLKDLKKAVRKNSIALVADMNGSARSLSIDYKLLKSLNLKLSFINNKAGEIVNPIVPEGQSLNQLKKHLEEKHKEDNSFVFGYMCDNDGDRGNIVYWDEFESEVKILEAQRLFALVSSIELALLKRNEQKEALVVNGPTSLLVDEIAEKWDVELFRAEVGEANVVTLANQLRKQGYNVRLLGEGSNGGSITHPSKVRDPLNTIIPLIKLLTDSTLFSKITSSKQKPSIALALNSFTPRRITDSFSSEGTLKIKTKDHSILKANYEKIFLEEWEKRSSYLKENFEIDSYEVIQLEGTLEKRGIGKEFRTNSETGGLKILFKDKEGNESDFIWLRGSQTEAVFRIVADTKTLSAKRYSYFLNWQKEMLLKADKS